MMEASLILSMIGSWCSPGGEPLPPKDGLGRGGKGTLEWAALVCLLT